MPWPALAALLGCLLVAALAVRALHGPRPDTEFYESASIATAALADIDAPGSVRVRLRVALDEWAAATNDRDFDRLMSFYAPRLQTYYRRHDVPSAEVLASQRRAVASLAALPLRVEAPEVRLNADGTVTTRVRTRVDAALELRWMRTEAGWRIVSER